MQRTRRNPRRWWLAALVGLLAVSVSSAFAANGIRIGAATDLALVADDILIETMGIRLEFDHGLRVVVTNGGASRVGDVHVPAFSATALPDDRAAPHALDLCVCRIGVVRRYPGGVAFVLAERNHEAVVSALTTHLRSIGARIGALGADGHAFDFTAEGAHYHAVVGDDPHGMVVYLGSY